MNTSPSPARITRFLGAAAVAGSLLAALTGCAGDDPADAAAPATSSAPAEQASESNDELWTSFVSVVDGDTIEVRPTDGKGNPTGEPNLAISMLGVKAPDASACGGPEAIAFLESRFLPGESVTVTYDSTLKDAVDEDGNPLAYLVTGAAITQDMGRIMITNGNAVAWHAEDEPAPERFARYEAEQKSATEAGKGLWGACGGMEN